MEKSTIVPLGALGAGKSALLNQLSLLESSHEGFASEACESKHTQEIETLEVGRVRLIDAPSFDPDNAAHLTQFIGDLQQATPTITLLPLVVNHFQSFAQRSVKKQIERCEEIFGGDEFWDHTCVIVTHYSNSPEQKTIRFAQGQTQERKEAQIRELISVNFPLVDKEGVPIYFVDIFDIGKDYDLTR